MRQIFRFPLTLRVNDEDHIAGFGQLFTKPFYWEKTQHGVSKYIARELAQAREIIP